MPVSKITTRMVRALSNHQHSYFVTDHRQAFQEQHFDPESSVETIWLHEERLRQKMRSDIFPDLPE
jgi:hypothetical protein